MKSCWVIICLCVLVFAASVSAAPDYDKNTVVVPTIYEGFDRGFWTGDWVENAAFPGFDQWFYYNHGKIWKAPDNTYPGDISIVTTATDVSGIVPVSEPKCYKGNYVDEDGVLTYIQRNQLPGAYGGNDNRIEEGYLSFWLNIPGQGGSREFYIISQSQGKPVFHIGITHKSDTQAILFDWKWHYNWAPPPTGSDPWNYHPRITYGEWHKITAAFDTNSYSLYLDDEPMTIVTSDTGDPNYGLPAIDLSGNVFDPEGSLATYFAMKCYNRADWYLDDIVMGVKGPSVTGVDMTNDGLKLSFEEFPHVWSNVVGAVMYTDDQSQPWKVAKSFDLFDTDTEWIDSGGPGRVDPRDPSVKKRFYKIGTVLPEACEAVPGYYVTSVKYVGNDGGDTDKHHAQLGMYTFADGGVASRKYWDWNQLDTPDTFQESCLIGTGIDTPPGNADTDKYVLGWKRFLDGESTMLEDTGTWTLTGRRIAITWASGDTESWYITFEDSYTLYKIELFEASYVKSGTLFHLNTDDLPQGTDMDEGRNLGLIPNIGFGFGSSKDFTASRRIGPEMLRYVRGVSLGYDAGDTVGNGLLEVQQTSVFGLYDFHITDTNVMRWIDYDDEGDTTAPWVYHYYCQPDDNTGNMARRLVYQSSRDDDNDGYVSDEGPSSCGLMIIDSGGRYRGYVSIGYSDEGDLGASYLFDQPDYWQNRGVLPE